jgi:hypothetical protein
MQKNKELQLALLLVEEEKKNKEGRLSEEKLQKLSEVMMEKKREM